LQCKLKNVTFMPKLDKATKEQIKNLEHKKLQEIVLKLAAKEKTAYDFIFANYLAKESGEEELFEETKEDLDLIFGKDYKGYAEQVRLAKMLNACVKRVNEFTKVSKNKVYEADLLLYIVEVAIPFDEELFGTCFTQFDTKVAVIVKRLINVVTKKLGEDYKVDYEKPINHYLDILHRRAWHNDTVHKLPKAI